MWGMAAQSRGHGTRVNDSDEHRFAKMVLTPGGSGDPAAWAPAGTRGGCRSLATRIVRYECVAISAADHRVLARSPAEEVDEGEEVVVSSQ